MKKLVNLSPSPSSTMTEAGEKDNKSRTLLAFSSSVSHPKLPLIIRNRGDLLSLTLDVAVAISVLLWLQLSLGHFSCSLTGDLLPRSRSKQIPGTLKAQTWFPSEQRWAAFQMWSSSHFHLHGTTLTASHPRYPQRVYEYPYEQCLHENDDIAIQLDDYDLYFRSIITRFAYLGIWNSS